MSARHRITVAERLSRATLRLAAVVAAALALAPGAHAGGPTIALGATEDAVRSPFLALSTAQMKLLALAGFRAVLVPVAAARYRLRVSASAAVNPGPALTILLPVRPG